MRVSGVVSLSEEVSEIGVPAGIFPGCARWPIDRTHEKFNSALTFLAGYFWHKKVSTSELLNGSLFDGVEMFIFILFRHLFPN